MSYTRTERDNAILTIGKGIVPITNGYLLQELESFNWIYIKKVNGVPDKIDLTYSGKELYKRLKKEETDNGTINKIF
ncbi:MAG: hypothetical protein ACTHJ5_16765 [Ilyomonas sp.]